MATPSSAKPSVLSPDFVFTVLYKVALIAAIVILVVCAALVTAYMVKFGA